MPELDDPKIVVRAFDFAVRAHEGQRRGHGRGEPYVNHVADVARRVALSPYANATTLVAALLHDVVEKTICPAGEVEVRFGAEVAMIVMELTDDETLSAREQQRRQVAAAPSLSPAAKRIKLADKASKLASIAEAPPRWWRRRRERREVDKALAVVEGLRGADPVLEGDFDEQVRRARAALGN